MRWTYGWGTEVEEWKRNFSWQTSYEMSTWKTEEQTEDNIKMDLRKEVMGWNWTELGVLNFCY